MSKKITVTVNGKKIEMSAAQFAELERDGMVIVGERIIRTGAYIDRVHKGVRDDISKKARRLFA